MQAKFFFFLFLSFLPSLRLIRGFHFYNYCAVLLGGYDMTSGCVELMAAYALHASQNVLYPEKGDDAT
jgi:hypothetical protein